MLQINYVVNNEEVFHLDYPYKSGITKTLKDLLHSTSKYSVDNFKFSKKPLAIDIGSNDGTLLEGFKNHGFKVLGIEPTNIAKLANKKGIKTIQKFFDYKTAKFIKKRYHKAEVITGTNIFAHINKLDSLMKGVKNLLVICPGFSSDCVETLEEIDIQGKESFLKNGGEKFDLIPCLNDSPDHIELFEKLLKRFY